MTDSDVPNDAVPDPADRAAARPDTSPDANPEAAGRVHHAKPHEHFVSPGAESTRELREMARRRREAEEKLQQHLQEAAQHGHGTKEKPAQEKPATQDSPPDADQQGPASD